MSRIYPFDEHPEFWSSYEALDQTAETAEVVNRLVDRAVRDPFGAFPNQDRVRVIKEPSSEKNGRTFQALRLAYTIGTRPGLTAADPEDEVVVLLQVRVYDEAAAARDAWLPGVSTKQ